MFPLTNPRLVAEFNDWPLGGSKRGYCKFAVEPATKRGVRISRVTTGKPKYTTYAGKSAIVDGSDGRTYILQRIDIYNGVKAMRSDFMDAQLIPGQQSSTAYRDSQPELYNELIALITQANEVPACTS